MVKKYVIAHKPVDFDKYNLNECYKITRVGKYGQIDSSILNDSSKDNKSQLLLTTQYVGYAVYY